MCSATQLPNEILMDIFDLMPLRDRFECQLVCKSWFGPSRQICYQDVKVNNTNILSLLRSFDTQQFSPFLYIKSLTIHFYPYFNCQRLLDKEEFCRLIQYCTQLERLMMAPSSVYWDYLSFFPVVHLRQLSYPEPPRRAPSNNSSYYDSLYKYKDSLTQLDIHCACDYWIRTNFGHLINYLAVFPSLQQLTIDGGSRISIIHLNNVLKTCTQLKQLHFGLDHPIFAPGDTAVTRYPTLHSLAIYLPDFSIGSLEYISNTFCDLQHLNLRLFHGRTHPWTDEQSKYIKGRFFAFLQQLSTYSIKFDMEAKCDQIEAAVLSQWTEPHLALKLDLSESNYERTQLDLVKGERNLVLCTKTFDPVHSLQAHELYFNYLGKRVTELTIKNHMDYLTKQLLSRLCPALLTLTLESPNTDIEIFDHHYHPTLTEIVLKRARLRFDTLQALCSMGNIQKLSITDSSVRLTEDTDSSYIRLPPSRHKEMMQTYFPYFSGELYLHNVRFQSVQIK
ncbi:unnamed protein product [Rhizopus stolonifer]